MMRILRHILSILALPGLVAIVIPVVLGGFQRRSDSGTWPLPLDLMSMGLGVVCLGLGLGLLVGTIHLFATAGEGTLAPWDPPHKLVIRGIYRHLRNPMITGLFCILLGEALIWEAPPLFAWWAAFVLLNLLYIPLAEEPGLIRRFGADYVRYQHNVPRWIPRLHPWNLPPDDATQGPAAAPRVGSTGDRHTTHIAVANLAQKYALFQEYWQPKIVGELNESQVKLVKLKGEFVWHHHEVEDELFLVVKGQLLIRLRDRELRLGEGEFAIIPHGVEHQPVAEGEVQVLLLEPKTTVNTGNVQDERTASSQWL